MKTDLEYAKVVAERDQLAADLAACWRELRAAQDKTVLLQAALASVRFAANGRHLKLI